MDGLAIGVEGGGNGWSCCDVVTNGDKWWGGEGWNGRIPHPQLVFASEGGGAQAVIVIVIIIIIITIIFTKTRTCVPKRPSGIVGSFFFAPPIQTLPVLFKHR